MQTTHKCIFLSRPIHSTTSQTIPVGYLRISSYFSWQNQTFDNSSKSQSYSTVPILLPQTNSWGTISVMPFQSLLIFSFSLSPIDFIFQIFLKNVQFSPSQPPWSQMRYPCHLLVLLQQSPHWSTWTNSRPSSTSFCTLHPEWLIKSRVNHITAPVRSWKLEEGNCLTWPKSSVWSGSYLHCPVISFPLHIAVFSF
jgi:hypothetical protein